MIRLPRLLHEHTASNLDVLPETGKEKARAEARAFPERQRESAGYIMPPMSGMPPPIAAPSFSGISATMHSVVRMFLAIDAAF